MKEYRGDEMRQIMANMPAELVASLRAAHAEHNITEREARWWGFLMFARSGSYEGDEFTMAVGTTGDVWTQRFIDYVLQNRAGDERHGLVRKAWPETGLER